MNQTQQSWVHGVLALGIVAVPTGARAGEPSVQGATFVRVLHAVDGAGEVDVFVDGQKKLNDVGFGSLSKYLRLSAGRHDVSVWAHDAARPLLVSSRRFRQGDSITLSAYGTMGQARLLLVDDSPGAQSRRSARLQVLNLVTGSGGLEVLASSESAGTYALSRRLRYGRSLLADVPAEPTTLRVRIAGRTIKSVNTFEPRPSRRYTAYLVGHDERSVRVVLGEAGAPGAP